MAFLDCPGMISVALALLLMVSGCHGDSSASGGLSGLPGGSSEERELPRMELLTLDEALGGDGALSAEPGVEEATTCGPDWSGYLPGMLGGEPTPDVVRFDRGDWWVAVGVWDDREGKNSVLLEDIKQGVHSDFCRLGRNSPGVHGIGSFEWRVYPVDVAEGVVAFQSVEWSVVGAVTPPPTPAPQEGLVVHSSTRAYGIVNDKLVMARISHYKAEPPSPEDLKVLWDAQVAKVRFHDAVVRNHEVQSSQSGSVDAPVSR